MGPNRIGARRVAQVAKVASDSFSIAKAQDRSCWTFINKLKPNNLSDCKTAIFHRGDGDDRVLMVENPKKVQFAHESHVMIIEGEAKEVLESEIPPSMPLDPQMLEQLQQAFAQSSQNKGEEDDEIPELVDSLDFQTIADEVEKLD